MLNEVRINLERQWCQQNRFKYLNSYICKSILLFPKFNTLLFPCRPEEIFFKLAGGSYAQRCQISMRKCLNLFARWRFVNLHIFYLTHKCILLVLWSIYKFYIHTCILYFLSSGNPVPNDNYSRASIT